jgi:uncharacterized spore protein YtfJ
VNENDAPNAPNALANVSQVASQVADGLSNLTDVSAERIFSEPVRAGDHVVVTAAAFDIGMGMGVGGGGDNLGNGGGGGGGGGRTEGRPVAAIDIGPDGVRVHPVIDFTRIGITALFAALAVWRATRRR